MVAFRISFLVVGSATAVHWSSALCTSARRFIVSSDGLGFLARPEYSSHQNGMDKCNRKERMKTFIVYDLDSKMPVAVGEQVSAETARYCASEITGLFPANLFAEEIDLEKKLRCYTRIGRLFLKNWR